jgi:hypothetical protein
MLAALRRFATRPEAALPCDLCGGGLDAVHEHVFDPARRDLRCACPGCAGLLSEAPASRWRRVRAFSRRLEAAPVTALHWNALAIPIEVAFLYRSTGGEGRAVYPSPAGATESHPSVGAWDSVAAEVPALAALAPDVEVLLVSRLGETPEQYVVSIDVAYALVGVMRRHWRGFAGGPEAWAAIARFFDTLRAGGEVAHG